MPAAKTLRAQNRRAARNRSTLSFTRSRVRSITSAISEGSQSDESAEALEFAVRTTGLSLENYVNSQRYQNPEYNRELLEVLEAIPH